MYKSFHCQEYMQDLGKELITDFLRAGKTTHPGSVGSGRERAVKNKLKGILPHGVGIGSGFIIDSFGNTSSQCDLIIYEEDYTLKFVINDDEDYAYYNCECVIAAGEIKSDASITDIEDAFEKLKKIRELKRHYEDERNFRCYLSKLVAHGTESEKYDPESKSDDQIFTFILCKSLKTPLSTIAERAKNIFVEKNKYVNFILPIEGNAIVYLNTKQNCICSSALTSDAFTEIIDPDSNFSIFVEHLTRQIQSGRTVRLNSERYIQPLTQFHIGTTAKI